MAITESNPRREIIIGIDEGEQPKEVDGQENIATASLIGAIRESGYAKRKKDKTLTPPIDEQFFSE